MSEFDLHGLQLLVTKLRHASDESLENVAREVAKFIHDSGRLTDTLKALVERGPLADGDVPSKEERDILLEVGLCVKVVAQGSDGANAAAQLSHWVWKAYKELTDAQKSDPEGADGVVGGSGADDSGITPISALDPVVSTEGLVDDLRVEYVWQAMSEQFHNVGKQTIQVNSRVITRYAELLSQTYCDTAWVKTQDSTLSDLDAKRVVDTAAVLQHHCWCLASIDVEKLDDAVALKLLEHAHRLHHSLYDDVS